MTNKKRFIKKYELVWMNRDKIKIFSMIFFFIIATLCISFVLFSYVYAYWTAYIGFLIIHMFVQVEALPYRFKSYYEEIKND